MSETKKEEVGNIYSVQAALGTDYSISVSGNFAKGATLAGMNAEIDQIRAVIERQRARAALLSAEETIKKHKVNLDYNYKDLEKLKAKDSLKSNDKQAIDTLLIRIEQAEADLSYMEETLVRIKKEAA